ncbi:MAG: hypothetical protein HUJ78_05970 [Mogibacterium sp.]|nr:hypothetical protein [Mogibacterium sp.]
MSIPEVTIVCCYNDKRTYEDFIDSLSTQTEPYELLGIDNGNGKFSSCSKAFNYAVKSVTTEYVIFSHQDILFTEYDTLEIFTNYMRECNDFALMGVAGTIGDIELTNIVHGKQRKPAGKPFNGTLRTNNMDECWFGCRTEWIKENPFNEELCNGWHLYSNERALYATSQNMPCYITDITFVHLSTGRADYSFYETFYNICNEYREYFDYIETTVTGSPTDKAAAYKVLETQKKRLKKEEKESYGGNILTRVIPFGRSILKWNRESGDIIKKYGKYSREELKSLRKDFIKKKMSVKSMTPTDYLLYEFKDEKNYSQAHTYFLGKEYKQFIKSINNDGDEKLNIRRLNNNRVYFNTVFSNYLNRKWFAIDKNTSFDEFLHWYESVGSNKLLELSYIDNRTIEQKKVVQIDSAEDIETFFDEIHNKAVIVQEGIEQHNELKGINPNGMQTVIIHLIRKNNKVQVSDALIRISTNCTEDINGKRKIYAGIDLNTGKINTPVQDLMHISKNTEHPTTKVSITGKKIPQWEKIIECSTKIFNDNFEKSGCISTEWTVDGNDNPVLIDISEGKNIDLRQVILGGLKQRI